MSWKNNSLNLSAERTNACFNSQVLELALFITLFKTMELILLTRFIWTVILVYEKIVFGFNDLHQKANIIPGIGCGIRTPYRHRKMLLESDDPRELPCTIVKDRKSFEKFYLTTLPSKFFS